MQPKPTSTHRKSDYAKQRRSVQQKATAGKQKINTSVIINLEEKWLDKQEVLQRLHISDSTLLKWRKKGLLPYSCVLGKFYYKESDLQKLLHNCNSANRA